MAALFCVKWRHSCRLEVWHQIEHPTTIIDAYLLQEQSCQISSRSHLKQRSFVILKNWTAADVNGQKTTGMYLKKFWRLRIVPSKTRSSQGMNLYEIRTPKLQFGRLLIKKINKWSRACLAGRAGKITSLFIYVDLSFDITDILNIFRTESILLG